MGSGIALDHAAILSTVLEGILYGFSLLMFIGTIRTLTREEGRHASNTIMISIAVILLVLSTAHMVVGIVRIDEGLVKYRDTFPGGPLAFFEDVAQRTFIIKNSIYALQTLLGDGVVIYRCYIVWQSLWVIALPSLLWCSVGATGIGAVYSISQATTNAENIFARQTGPWIMAFYASTLSCNLLSSGLLAYRIWTMEHHASSLRTSKRRTMMPILRVLVDAAALYSATLFTALLCFVNSNNAQFVVADMIMPIISIAFYMVLVRIAVERMDRHSFCCSTRPQLGPLQVHISQFSESNVSYSGNQEPERESQSFTDKRGSLHAVYIG